MKILDKNSLIVTDKLAQEVINIVKQKKPHALLDQVRFTRLEEGLCVQMLHLGPYDDEPESFSIMEDYCKQNNLRRIEKIHREIYLSDARKIQPNKLKTVLRFKVEYLN